MRDMVAQSFLSVSIQDVSLDNFLPPPSHRVFCSQTRGLECRCVTLHGTACPTPKELRIFSASWRGVTLWLTLSGLRAMIPWSCRCTSLVIFTDTLITSTYRCLVGTEAKDITSKSEKEKRMPQRHADDKKNLGYRILPLKNNTSLKTLECCTHDCAELMI